MSRQIDEMHIQAKFKSHLDFSWFVSKQCFVLSFSFFLSWSLSVSFYSNAISLSISLFLFLRSSTPAASHPIT